MSISRIAIFLAVTISSRAEFPAPYDSETDLSAPRMSAEEAAAKFQVPPGFKVSVFAAEPDVQNPIAMSWDARGRLWIAENYTYAERAKKFELGLRDRIVIFDGTNGPRFTKRTIFTDDVQMLTSIEVGLGGVWLMCPPQLLFIPDRDCDDKPDGPAEVMLDGFTPPAENYHNFANGLRFGPDGWLYGRCGASSPGEVGKPGTPASERIPLRGTLWRFHPRTLVFEALSSGCTNPWGNDWDEHGELFFINTVNGHLWHGTTGAHYMRPHTIDPNPHVYALIDQHADHWHFDTGQGWTKSRGGAANSLGGGHAHIGMMIYQGDNWPAKYRGKLFTWNMHGRRMNQEILRRHGSGYVGKHGQDVFLAADPWFRGIELGYGPDGGVFALDWSDTGECHENTGVHRTSGRIFKITYGEPKRVEPFDLAKVGGSLLVMNQLKGNEWFARQSRLQLAARAAGGQPPGKTFVLRETVEEEADSVLQLRALWAMHLDGRSDESMLVRQLQHPNEHIRTWAIRLLADHWPLDTCMSQRPPNAKESVSPELFARLESLAKSDTSGLVRLTLASALQRLPVKKRAGIASALVARNEDAADHNLPLLVWYGLIPVAHSDPSELVKVAVSCEWPLTRRLIARRLVEDIETKPAAINALLEAATTKSSAYQSDILAGLADGLTGWRKAPKPKAWDAFAKAVASSNDDTLAARVRDLDVVFGSGRALDEVKRVALDGKAELGARKAALRTLIDSRPDDLREICERLLGTRFLNAVAVRGLALFDDAAIADKLVKSYRSFHPSERAAVIDTLISRPSFAKAMLAAVEGGKGVPRSDITPFHARQIRAFNDPDLTKLLADAWGDLREPAADKKALIAKLKTALTPDILAKADLAAGRATYTAVCAACHRLYGQGGELGPDLTGAGRSNLDYLLDNIADPSAVVNADYRMSLAEMKDGRTLTGVVAADTGRTVTLRTPTGSVTIERAELKSLTQSPASLMPEGLLEALPPEQVRNLIAYLMHPSQVPLHEEKK